MRFVLLFVLAVSAFAQSPEEKAWQTIEHALQDANSLRRSDAVLAMAVVRAQPRPVKRVGARR
jgi:hypothetical protein